MRPLPLFASAVLASGLVALPALAADPQPQAPPAAQPLHIPTSNGEVILPTENDRRAYEKYGYAAVRRSGDLIFISGVVAGRRPDEGTDVEAFKNQVRRAFRRIDGLLEASGASFDDVVMINSFHVWNGPNFSGTRDQQFEAFEQVKEEFMKGPHPAWTAVGTTGLLGDTGIVEIQMIADAPSKRRK